METVKTLLESTKEDLKMKLWWAEEHDKESKFIDEIPILKQKITEINKALSILLDDNTHCECGSEYYHTYKCVNINCNNCVIKTKN